jgi:triosephosphate isomerase
MRKLVAGNWKMNGLSSQIEQALAISADLAAQPAASRVAICPPAILLSRMAERLAGSAIELGGQDLHANDKGAHTGDVSGHMLHDAGATLVIIGHSERRTDHRESNAHVAAKVEAALRAGLEPIICVGETLAERKSGKALEVVVSQLAGSLPNSLNDLDFAVAYEPVWAIGTGLTPSLAEIEEMHRAIRKAIVGALASGARAPILYGGSVKPSNAQEILHAAEVGGALVGGASLTAADFLPIIRAAG